MNPNKIEAGPINEQNEIKKCNQLAPGAESAAAVESRVRLAIPLFYYLLFQ